MMSQPLKPFKAQFTLSFKGLDIGCAGKQVRDAQEALEDLGFSIELAAWGEPSAIGEHRDGASECLGGLVADAPSRCSLDQVDAATREGRR